MEESGYFEVFPWVILGIFHHVLGNKRHSLEHLHESADIKVVATKPNLSVLDIFGYFWSIFYYVAEIVGNHITFLYEFL